MQKKILSIDFDIIMHPCIELYNDDIDTGDIEELWKYIENEYGLDNNNLLTFDSSLLLELAKLISHYKNKPIHWIQDHDEVVKILKETSTFSEDVYDIYNIDFHHDLWYREEDFDEILKDDQYNVSDWLGYLFLKKKLKSLTWIKAPNSVDVEIKAYGHSIAINNLYFSNMYQLYNIDFDEIFFCLSPHWIPPKYHFLYDLFKILIKGE